MNLKMRVTLGACLALLIVFSGCRSHRKAGAGAGPVRVVTARVAAAETGREFAYSGTIVESETLPQSFAVTGTVTRVAVHEGDFVARGALLAEIDATTYRQSLEMARATEKQAEDAFGRLSRMFQKGHLPEVKYVEVETGLAKARAASAIARKNLADCSLRASAAGYVGKCSVDPGMVVLPHVDSITLVQIERVFAKVPVPENDVPLLHRGDRAVVRIGALGSREFTGQIEEIGVVADPLAHTYPVRIAIANPERLMRPGMVCTAAVRGLERSSGLVIPNQAVLVDENGRNYVYCLDGAGTKAFVRPVTLGELLQNGIRVTAGLKTGDAVVVAGQHQLAPGAAVQVVER